MPYIKDYLRDELKEYRIATSAGELNFLFTSDIVEYLRTKGESYATFNDVIGALEACRSEFNRRIVAPYEDVKIKENGDVYGIEQQATETGPPPELRR